MVHLDNLPRLLQQLGDERGQAISLLQLSILYLLKEDYATALRNSEEAEKLARKLRDDYILAGSLHQKGLICSELARTARSDEEGRTHLQAAGECFRSSLGLKQRIGDEAGAAHTLGELAKLLQDAGRMEEAIAAFNEVLTTHERLGMREKIGITLGLLGNVHERQGEHEAALEKYQQAFEVLRQYGSPEDQAIVKHDIARVQARLRGAG